jgi:DNA-binding protein H-NS
VTLITIARAITPVTNVRNRTILIVTQYRQLNEMTVEQLWDLHQEVAAQLTRKVTLEKAKWEERLRRVSSVSHLVGEDVKRERRPYPKVPAKYCNPKNPEETWAGRGRQPRWLAAQLRSGKQLDQFLIRRSS